MIKITIKKGYTREKALKVFLNRTKKDIRGFKYDPKTGVCCGT